jgi:hypothetical protein
MFSTLLSIALVAVILGAAAYFLIAQRKENQNSNNTGITGNSDNENTNDTSGHGGKPGWSE